MLLVLDLDDTLINTFHSVTLPAYRSLISELNRRNNVQLPEKKAFKDLEYFRCTSQSSYHAMQRFFKKHDLKNSLEWALDYVYYYNDYGDVELSPGVMSFLQDNTDVACAIVTRGVESRQKQKIAKSFLRDFKFERVVVVPTGDKSLAYRSLIDEFNPGFCVLVADRSDDFMHTEGLFSKRVLFTPSYFLEAQLNFFADLKLSNFKDLRDVLQ
jgi:FMN phosphatase YigB (HAD superfamily)